MIKQFKAEVIAVGTEILLGQIANTNAQWISQKLALYGINVYNHVVVGDNLERVAHSFSEAQDRSDIIIVTGGLGPTEDDLTREAFQILSDLNIIEHIPSMKRIEDYFKRHEWKMTPNNRRQARVFEFAKVLENKTGMAPGMIVEYEGRVWIFLPGVPREMKALFTDDVLPFLYKLTGKQEVIQSSILKFIGIGESTLEHELKDLIHLQTNPTIAPLATDEGVIIRLTAKGRSSEELEMMLNETKSLILEKVGDFFIAENDETIEEVIINQLKTSERSIAVAESLTGGRFLDKLISVSGSSSVVKGGVVCYDPAVKVDTLGVPEQVIKDHGTVSEECAIILARNVREKMNANIGLSFTGIAGPGEIEDKPVGTVYIGVSIHGQTDKAIGINFIGDRQTVRNRAVLKGLEIIFNELKS
ncbi:competence/damage-inducible protein A [Oceanobacillus sp. CAU 1775]